MNLAISLGSFVCLAFPLPWARMVKKREGKNRSISKSFISIVQMRGNFTPTMSLGSLIFIGLPSLLSHSLAHNFIFALGNIMNVILIFNENQVTSFAQQQDIFEEF